MTPTNEQKPTRRGRALLWIAAVFLAIGGIAVVVMKVTQPGTPALTTPQPSAPSPANVTEMAMPEQAPAPPALEMSNAAQLVSNKLARFVRLRRDHLNHMAGGFGIEVPIIVQQFFEAAEAGDWSRTGERFGPLKDAITTEGPVSMDIRRLWGPIVSVYGVAEQVGKWPPQQLLDYGEAILGSLTPGMAYFGGTDEGRFIPELLAETAEEKRHVVITQNALADNTYLEFLAVAYSNRLNTLTQADSQQAFQDYMADAQKRLEHDKAFPNDPKQIKPGEVIEMVNNRVQVSGAVAVMAINERLVLTLLRKNPEVSFGLQESFPLRGTYGHAVPLGCIVQIGVKDAHARFTAQLARQTADYWRTTTDRLSSDAEAMASTRTMHAFSKLATGHANLLADWQHLEDAEQTYRQSLRMWPGNIESMGGLAELLIRTGRGEAANTVLDEFQGAFPDRSKEVDRTRARLRSIRVTAPLLRK